MGLEDRILPEIWADIADLRDDINELSKEIESIYGWQRLLLKGLQIIAANGGQPHHVADQLTALLEKGP